MNQSLSIFELTAKRLRLASPLKVGQLVKPIDTIMAGTVGEIYDLGSNVPYDGKTGELPPEGYSPENLVYYVAWWYGVEGSFMGETIIETWKPKAKLALGFEQIEKPIGQDEFEGWPTLKAETNVTGTKKSRMQAQLRKKTDYVVMPNGEKLIPEDNGDSFYSLNRNRWLTPEEFQECLNESNTGVVPR